MSGHALRLPRHFSDRGRGSISVLPPFPVFPDRDRAAVAERRCFRMPNGPRASRATSEIRSTATGPPSCARGTAAVAYHTPPLSARVQCTECCPARSPITAVVPFRVATAM